MEEEFVYGLGVTHESGVRMTTLLPIEVLFLGFLSPQTFQPILVVRHLLAFDLLLYAREL